MKIVKVNRKVDASDEKRIGYVTLVKFREDGPWEFSSISHPNVVFGTNLPRIKAYLKEIQKQAKDLEAAVKLMEKENA